MKKISRKIFHECIANANERKALALLIFCKTVLPSSTLSKFTYNKLHLITGLHANTLKKRIKTLNDMGLLQRVGKYNQHILFCNVRDKHSNLVIDRIDFSSVKSIEEGLLAMFIVEKQNQKNYVRQLLAIKENPKSNDELKIVKRICRKRGYTDFKDNGMSYKYIAKKLKVSVSKAFSIVKHAVERLMIFKQTHFNVVAKIVDGAKKYFEYFFGDRSRKNKFATCDYVFHVSANTYHIPTDWESWNGSILDYKK